MTNGHSHHLPAVHGMLMFGDNPIYLSHLPMFHPLHAVQLIMEATFAGAGDPAAIYRRDRAATREKIYTWVPDAFPLPELLERPAGGAQMTGRIFRGHFERGGEAITGAVSCVVSRNIHSRSLSASGPRDTRLRYLLFGTAEQGFAAHVITGPPDFDHVIGVEGAPPPGPSARIVQIEERSNDPASRFQPQQSVQGGGEHGGTLRCLEEIYLETADLER